MPSSFDAAIRRELQRSFDRFVAPQAPATLTAAMQHAVFPGGKRLRPELLVRVADAIASQRGAAAVGPAAALELLHCASLVHDDLPCFDDADVRRGAPSVHRRFGEAMAVLVGDGLIVLAFRVAVESHLSAAQRGRVVQRLARAVGADGGLVAGQACESDPRIDWRTYHRSKTAALFEAAVEIGATVAGQSGPAWTAVGTALGMGYQLADDLLDCCAAAAACGKPTLQDLRHDRPNAAIANGVSATRAEAEDHLAAAVRAIPSCPGAASLREWLLRTGEQMLATLDRGITSRVGGSCGLPNGTHLA